MKKIVLMTLLGCFSLAVNAQMVSIKPNPKIQVSVDPGFDINIDPSFDFNFDFDFEPSMDFDLGNFNESFNFGGSSKELYQEDTQEVEVPLSKPGQRGKLNVESHNGQVKISAYEGATVKVKMIKYSKKVEKSSDKAGMRLLSSGGFSVQAEEYNNTVTIENEGWGNRVDFEIQIPAGFDISAETYNNGNIEITGIKGEMNVESYNGPITLKDISGSVSASTYNGQVLVTFKEVTPNAPMIFSTYNGNIDLTVPAGTKFSTKMKTNREIYTDFEGFNLKPTAPKTERSKEGNGYSLKYENWVEGTLNGGGAEVMMETHNGNIYIRKG
uniref:DUF4097 family beta strand repeat-containing protein n=1 Tax=Roseivirga sp. TaxID=1964215 RepID=UPI0040483993